MIYAGVLAEKHCIQCPLQMAQKWLMREEKEERMGQHDHSLAVVGSRVIIEAYICSNELSTKQLPICDHLIMEYCVFVTDGWSYIHAKVFGSLALLLYSS